MKANMPVIRSALRAGLAAMLLITMLLSTAVVPAGAANGSDSSVLTALAVTPVSALDSAGAGGETLLQFTSGRHVLGFGSQAVYLAGLDHALRVEFSGGRPVQPVGESAAVAQNGIAELGRLHYSGVWEHIDVTFSAVGGGIAESTYIIHPGGDPTDISLRYNVPVEITPQGGLRLSFASGYMTESPPVAWQEIDGERQSVEVGFQLVAENQVGFALGSYDAAQTVCIDPTYQWHTFYGSTGFDSGRGIAVDSSSNVYVVGGSPATWNGPAGQEPLNAHAGGPDIVVVKLNPDGDYQWHTFYGSTHSDKGLNAIAVDFSSNVYVAGYSEAGWNGPAGQEPLSAHAGEYDIVVVKLDTDGDYQWHTFHGSTHSDYGLAIAVDSSSNVCVAGYSRAGWNGSAGQEPLNAHAGGEDIVVVKLDADGDYQWHTFYGSTHSEYGLAIAVDSSDNVYAAGHSWAGWNGPAGEEPLNPHAGDYVIVVVKLDTNGDYQWHTFYGSTDDDRGYGIAVDRAANVYVTAFTGATWNGPGGQPPLNAYADGDDIVVVKLDTNGDYQWHTFYGSGATDRGLAIAVDFSANVYVAGYSGASWNGPGAQPPLNAYAGGDDIVVVKLDTNGDYQWHTFYGSTGYDFGWAAIAVDSSSNVYVAGFTGFSWSGPQGQAPLNAHITGDHDIVVLKLGYGSPLVATLGGGAYPMWSVFVAAIMAGAILLVLSRRRRGQESA